MIAKSVFLAVMIVLSAAQADRRPPFEGEYELTGLSSDGAAGYRGHTTIARTGQTYAVVQSFAAGGKMTGIGVADSDHLAVVFADADGATYVAIYRRLESGDLEGRWTMPGLETTGREVLSLTRPGR